MLYINDQQHEDDQDDAQENDRPDQTFICQNRRKHKAERECQSKACVQLKPYENARDRYLGVVELHLANDPPRIDNIYRLPPTLRA